MHDPAIAEHWLSLEKLLRDERRDPVAAVRAGLPYAILDHVRRVLGAPDAELIRMLGISKRTLARRKKQGRLQPAESDRLLLLAGITQLATEALDSLEHARAWLTSPHALLGGESPLAHMDTIAGIEEVRTMLYHIEYSMPA